MNLQISDLDPSKAWEITPNSDVVYGALVIMLCVIIVVLYRKLLNVESEYREVVNTVHEVSRETVKNLSEIDNKTEINMQKITNLLDRIIDKLHKY